MPRVHSPSPAEAARRADSTVHVIQELCPHVVKEL
jgi:hypothetical protein